MQKFCRILPSLMLLQTCIAFRDELALLASEHPFTSKLKSIGKSNLQAIQINSEPGHNRQCLQPMVKFVANSRGNNTKSSELLIDFAKYLLSGYAQRDQKIIDLVDNYDIHILPSMNPEAEIDINGDFPVWKSKQMTNDELLNHRKPDTQALLTWILENPFQLSVNVDGSSSDNSAMKDFHHYFTSGEEVQVHMSEPNSDRQTIFNANKDKLLNQFDSIFTGIKGFVLDHSAEFATNARLTFEDEEKPVYTTSNCGEFWHALKPGEYNVTAWGTDNYRSKVMKVKIESGKTIRVDFVLDQIAAYQPVPSKMYPNPELYRTSNGGLLGDCSCKQATVVTEAPLVFETGLNFLSISHTMASGDKRVTLMSERYPSNYPNGPYSAKTTICHEDPNGRLQIEFPRDSFDIQEFKRCRRDRLIIARARVRGKDLTRKLCGNRLANSFSFISATNCFKIDFFVNNDAIGGKGFLSYISTV